jgi:hypothetical protein
MSRAVLREHIQELADEHGLRWFPDIEEARGMVRGVGFQVMIWGDEIQFFCFAPGADLHRAILGGFASFERFTASGLRASWLRGVVETDSGCLLRVEEQHLASVGEDRFLGIPVMIAEDFHAHGASEHPVCQHCRETDATEVMQIERIFYCVCLACWQNQAKQAEKLGVPTVLATPLPTVLLRLGVLLVVGAVAWSLYLQSQINRREFALSRNLALAHAAFGFIVASVAMQGSVPWRWPLRFLMAATAVTASVVGGLWGCRCWLVAQGLRADPLSILEVYYQFWLVSPAFEWLFSIAGVVGTIVGGAVMAPKTHVEFR